MTTAAIMLDAYPDVVAEAKQNKSNYVLITNRAQLKQLNPKRLGE